MQSFATVIQWDISPSVLQGTTVVFVCGKHQSSRLPLGRLLLETTAERTSRVTLRDKKYRTSRFFDISSKAGTKPTFLTDTHSFIVVDSFHLLRAVDETLVALLELQNIEREFCRVSLSMRQKLCTIWTSWREIEIIVKAAHFLFWSFGR